MSFEEDLEKGERAERFVVEQLKKEMPTLKKVEGYNPDYDLIDDRGFTIEVKLDRKSQETKNVGVEFKHRGEPTAISTSKAMEWIIIYYNNGWRYVRVATEQLRGFLRNNWKYLSKIKGKGDKSSLVLISIDDLEKHFTYEVIDD